MNKQVQRRRIVPGPMRAGVLLALVFALVWPDALVDGKGPAKAAAGQERILRAIYPRAPRSLDPHGPPDPAAWPVIMASYHRLMTFDQGTAKPVPSLAKTVLVSPDGLKYTFQLNEGLTFVDGTVLNTEAALFSFNRLMLSEVGQRYYPYLRRFEVVGPYTFRLMLSRPWPPFLTSLALPQASLVSPDLAHRPEDFLAQRTLGSGPYQVYDWRDDTIGLQTRPDQTAAMPISFVMFHYEPDPRKRLDKALVHQAHLVIEPAPADGPLPANYQLKKIPGFSVRYLAFNTRRPRTGTPNIRRALSAVVNQAFADYPGHLQGPFPAGLFYNEPPRPGSPPPAESDPLAQARYVLSDAGPPPTPLSLVYPAEGGPELGAEAQTIAEALSAFGWRVSLSALQGPEGRRIFESGQYDLYLGSRSPDIPSPDMWLGRFLDSTSTVDGNPAFFQHPRADRLIGEIVNQVGRDNDGPAEYRQLEADRAAKVAELAELARTEAPYAFLYQLEDRALVDARLANLSPHPAWPEVWPIDRAGLKPYSFRSGANPTGRTPGDIQTGPEPFQPQGPARVGPRPPTAPETPAAAPIQGPVPAEAARPGSNPDLSPATGSPLAPEMDGSDRGPQPEGGLDLVLDYFELEQLDDPAEVPSNPNPDFDEFLGVELP